MQVHVVLEQLLRLWTTQGLLQWFVHLVRLPVAETHASFPRTAQMMSSNVFEWYWRPSSSRHYCHLVTNKVTVMSSFYNIHNNFMIPPLILVHQLVHACMTTTCMHINRRQNGSPLDPGTRTYLGLCNYT